MLSRITNRVISRVTIMRGEGGKIKAGEAMDTGKTGKTDEGTSIGKMKDTMQWELEEGEVIPEELMIM